MLFTRLISATTQWTFAETQAEIPPARMPDGEFQPLSFKNDSYIVCSYPFWSNDRLEGEGSGSDGNEAED